MVSDKEILKWYMSGFHDELWSKWVKPTISEHLLVKSYSLGQTHAIIGDDVSSIDKLSNEEIIKIIRKN